MSDLKTQFSICEIVWYKKYVSERETNSTFTFNKQFKQKFHSEAIYFTFIMLKVPLSKPVFNNFYGHVNFELKLSFSFYFTFSMFKIITIALKLKKKENNITSNQISFKWILLNLSIFNCLSLKLIWFFLDLISITNYIVCKYMICLSVIFSSSFLK